MPDQSAPAAAQIRERPVVARAALLLVAVVVGLLITLALALFVPGGKVLHCPDDRVPSSMRCVAVSGRVVYVEHWDPDGDGDLHVALLSRDSDTWPGISVIKFSKARRPRHAPGLAHWVSVIGYEYRGERGERNIRVVDYRVSN